MFREFICKIGLHWMKEHNCHFVDVVSGKPMYHATCTCGKEWMVDTLFPISLFKVKMNRKG